VNTGKGCHLDAQMIADAAPRLPLADNGILFIENVGNLVCPASLISANVTKSPCCR
jgi:hydrogenase nickel incorporation protein HypB